MTFDETSLHDQTIFVDANAIIYHLQGLSPVAGNVFELAEQKLVKLISTAHESRIPITLEPKRKPHQAIAGKGKILEDLIRPLADEADWEMSGCDYEIINNKHIRR